MDRLRVMACDHLNLARSKYIAISKADSGVTRMSQGVFGLTYNRDLIPAPGSLLMEGLGDMELRWNPKDIRDSWVEGEKIVVGQFHEIDGGPLALCGRSALVQAIADWEDMGHNPKVGIELEAYAFVYDENDKLVPLQTPGSYVYGTGPHNDPIGFTDAIWEAAHAAGMPLELITTEYDEAQFEFVLTFGDALEAVDNIFLFKQLAREVALESDVVLTFMPKPITDRGGNGVHINFSFMNGDKNTVMNGSDGGPDNMSDVAKGCVAGLVHHHQGLAGLVAPSVGSFERLQPASMSGYWQNWGGDHRSVTTRVSSEGGKKARIEHRMADASANPYTATAAVLQAARLGVVNGYELPLRETGDGFEDVSTKIGVGANLNEALDHLEADTALCNAVSQGLIDNHVFIKRAEVSEVDACETDEDKRDYYIHYI
jgi:glutamine synthetase